MGVDTEVSEEVKGQQEMFREIRENIPVNVKEEIVSMEWNNERLAKVFTSLGDTMYFCQWGREGREASLYKMQIGGDSLQKMDLEIPDGMDIYGMASDDTGGVYLLFHTASTDADSMTGMIRAIDGEGSLLKEVDISEALSEKLWILEDFLVDKEGRFYLKGAGRTVCISGEGSRLWEMDNALLGLKNSYVIAPDADGVVYMAYQRQGDTYLGEVDSVNGTLAEEYLMADIDSGDRILAMEQGTDSDLLLYGCTSGIWAWNREGKLLEKRADRSESELAYNEYIVIRDFLEDGRLLLVKNISEGDALVGITCDYIPAGK